MNRSRRNRRGVKGTESVLDGAVVRRPIPSIPVHSNPLETSTIPLSRYSPIQSGARFDRLPFPAKKRENRSGYVTHLVLRQANHGADRPILQMLSNARFRARPLSQSSAGCFHHQQSRHTLTFIRQRLRKGCLPSHATVTLADLSASRKLRCTGDYRLSLACLQQSARSDCHWI